MGIFSSQGILRVFEAIGKLKAKLEDTIASIAKTNVAIQAEINAL